MRAVIAVLLFAVFAFVATGNAVGVVQAMRRRRADPTGSGFSMVPLLGGLAGALACVVAPLRGLARWWWVPLVVDLGCAALLVFAATAVLRRS